MLLEGAQALSDRELLSILIGSGIRGRPVHRVAQSLLDAAKGDLAVLSKMPPEGYALVEGIGIAKAVQISAALELGRRRQVKAKRRDCNEIIRSSKDVYGCKALSNPGPRYVPTSTRQDAFQIDIILKSEISR